MERRVVAEVNGQIAVAAARFSFGNRSVAFEFLCECGCMDRVVMTLADYRAARGAWLPDHDRDGARGQAVLSGARTTS